MQGIFIEGDLSLPYHCAAGDAPQWTGLAGRDRRAVSSQLIPVPPCPPTAGRGPGPAWPSLWGVGLTLRPERSPVDRAPDWGVADTRGPEVPAGEAMLGLPSCVAPRTWNPGTGFKPQPCPFYTVWPLAGLPAPEAPLPCPPAFHNPLEPELVSGAQFPRSRT